MERRSQSRFETLTIRVIESMKVPLLLVRLGTSQVANTNSTFRNLTHLKKSEIKGHEITDLFAPESFERVNALIELMTERQTRSIEEFDCLLLKRGGRELNVNLVANRLRVGKAHFILISVQDLTSEKKAQAQREMDLRELGQISKLADIGMLAAGVAHELNNPLMIVQGYAENVELLLQQPEVNRGEVHNQVTEILKAADRMARLIAQMTRMVRSSDVKFEVIELKELVQGTLRFLNHEVKLTEIETAVDFPGPALVRCDPGQIEQVLLNIMSNAIHALSQVPKPRQLKVSCQSYTDGHLLKIWNNGPVIPKEVQDRVMTPFFTTKDPGKGTGLGLPVSFGIMKAHGGALRFTSNEKSKTEFQLLFPKAAVRILPTPIKASKLAVIIDTDVDSTEILSQKLAAFGLKTIRFSSGPEAIDYIRQNSDVIAVFTELRLAGMDGAEIGRQLQVLPQPPAVVAVTGFKVTPGIEAETQNANFVGILQKPINHNLFTVIIQKILKDDPQRSDTSA